MKTKRIFSEKEIIEIIEKELPKIIKKNPEVRMRIEEILEKKAATKEDIKAILLELKKQREETNRRFEEVNKRFEDINKRFEDINRRFEELVKEMREGFELMRQELDKRISALGSRWGFYAEEAFRRGFEELLPELGYKVIKWRKMDKRCEIFSKPRPAEIDILIRDEKKIAIEVKSSLTVGELEIFLKSTKFYEKEEKEKIDEKIVVTVFPYPGVEEYAKDIGVKIIKSEYEAKEYLK